MEGVHHQRVLLLRPVADRHELRLGVELEPLADAGVGRHPGGAFAEPGDDRAALGDGREGLERRWRGRPARVSRRRRRRYRHRLDHRAVLPQDGVEPPARHERAQARHHADGARRGRGGDRRRGRVRCGQGRYDWHLVHARRETRLRRPRSQNGPRLVEDGLEGRAVIAGADVEEAVALAEGVQADQELKAVLVRLPDHDRQGIEVGGHRLAAPLGELGARDGLDRPLGRRWASRRRRWC